MNEPDTSSNHSIDSLKLDGGKIPSTSSNKPTWDLNDSNLENLVDTRGALRFSSIRILEDQDLSIIYEKRSSPQKKKDGEPDIEVYDEDEDQEVESADESSNLRPKK